MKQKESLRIQTTALAVIISIVLTGALILSLGHAGIMDLQGQDTTVPAESATRYEIINATSTDYIRATASGLSVQFSCLAQGLDSVFWDFGDYTGNSEGTPVLHQYSTHGEYLVQATIRFTDGRKLIEYHWLDLTEPSMAAAQAAAAPPPGSETLYDVDVPGVGTIWTFYTWSLLMSGIICLVLFAITFYHRQKNRGHIWPRAFTPELRLALGMGLIFCYFVAIGLFNSVIAAFGGI